MANIQTECLNTKCSNKVSDGNKWCCMECKKQFLLDNYSEGICLKWFEEFNKDFKEKQHEVLKMIKDSGMSASEFLRALGEFNEN